MPIRAPCIGAYTGGGGVAGYPPKANLRKFKKEEGKSNKINR